MDAFVGPQLISITEVGEWLDMNGIQDQEKRLELYRLITVLDADWLERHGEERELNSKSESAQDEKRKRPRGRNGTFGNRDRRTQGA